MSEQEPTVNEQNPEERQALERQVQTHQVLQAIRVLVHGHPLEVGMSGIAAALVELGNATIGFDSTMQLIVDAQAAWKRHQKHQVEQAQAAS